MKRNLSLLAVLVILLAIIQFKYRDQSSTKSLFSLELAQVENIKFPHVEILKTGDLIYTSKSKLPVADQMWSSVHDYFSNLLIVQSLGLSEMNENERAKLFENSVNIKFSNKNEVLLELTIGGFSPLSGLFAVKSSEYPGQFLWIKDDNAAVVPYEKESEAALKKFQRLKQILNYEESDLMQKLVLDKFFQHKIVAFSIGSPIQVEIDLMKQVLKKPNVDTELDLEQVQNFLLTLKQLKVSQYYSMHKKEKLGKKILELGLETSEQTVDLSFHHGLAGESGFYLSSSQFMYIFKVPAQIIQLLDQDWSYFVRSNLIKSSELFKCKGGCCEKFDTQKVSQFFMTRKADAIMLDSIKAEPYCQLTTQSQSFDLYRLEQKYLIRNNKNQLIYQINDKLSIDKLLNLNE